MYVIVPISLEESGQTAMGPAMLISILLAGRIPGSKVNFNYIRTSKQQSCLGRDTF